MVGANRAFFQGFIGDDSVWADDYGWCGLACLAARDYLLAASKRPDAAAYLEVYQALRAYQKGERPTSERR